MKPGSKYWSLYEYLRGCDEGEIELSFAEIETIIREPLPASARARRDWWGNRKNALQASAWMQAGYHAEEIDLDRQSVIFRRPIREYTVRREGDTILWNANMIKALRLHMDMNQTQFADELGVRQQTISEWENNVYEPSRATCKYLTLVAEQAGFGYGETEQA